MSNRPKSSSYISQVRQEIATRLHARLYPGGVGPSKVRQTDYLYLWYTLTTRSSG